MVESEWSCVRINTAMGENLDQSTLYCIALKIHVLRNSFVLGKYCCAVKRFLPKGTRTARLGLKSVFLQ